MYYPNKLVTTRINSWSCETTYSPSTQEYYFFKLLSLPPLQFHFANRHCNYFNALRSLVADRDKKTALGTASKIST